MALLTGPGDRRAEEQKNFVRRQNGKVQREAGTDDRKFAKQGSGNNPLKLCQMVTESHH